jgi:hypothetical protein
MGKVFDSFGLSGGTASPGWRLEGWAGLEEGNLVVARFALPSGLRQQGRAFGPVGLSWGFAPGWYRAGLWPSFFWR